MKAKETAPLGSVLGEDAALQTSTPKPYSWRYTQPTQLLSSSEVYVYNQSTRG